MAEKIKMNMIAGGFQHEICSSAGAIPKYVEWIKGERSADISMHIDNGITLPVDRSKRNYAWLLESSAIIPDLINWVITNIPLVEDKFEFIFTHDLRLLHYSPKMKFTIPNAVPWIVDRKIYDKSKLMSMIASNKRYCPGHTYRHQILGKFRYKIDCYGRGWNDIQNKEDGLKDYYFSIAMENDNYPQIFCEKITDCFATGTMPVFWGTPNIGDFFNDKGIIMLTDHFKVEDVSPELYYSKMEYIKENLERAINLPTAEDYIYENYIK